MKECEKKKKKKIEGMQAATILLGDVIKGRSVLRFEGKRSVVLRA